MFDKDDEEIVTAENAHTKLKDDDVAVVIRPTFDKNMWAGKVDLSALIMPITRLTEDEHDLIKDTMYALVTCFHLLNTNQDFADRVSEEMDRMANSGELGDIKEKKVVSHLSTWTKTQGNA